jgi:hypothetical protein
MKRPDKKTDIVVPTHDYQQALQKAVSWLGDRYLLAEPARRRDTRSEYFNTSPDWFSATRAPLRARH